MGLTFNNERRDYLIVQRGRKRPAWSPITRNIQSVLGRAGGYLQSTQTQVRTITVPIFIKCNSMEELQEIKEDLALWLIHDEKKELIFDDESERVYYALVEDELDLDEHWNHATGELKFICPDAYKYNRYEKVERSSIIDGRYLLTANNTGSTTALPIIEMIADQKYTHIDISDGTKINRIGKVVNVDQYAPADYEETVLFDELDRLTNWSKVTGTNTRIDGATGGTMKTNGYSFQAADFGTNTGQWHGAFYVRPLPAELENFIIETVLEFTNPKTGLYGKVEIYLLDKNDEVVCKLALKNSSGDDTNNIAEVRAGDADINRYFITGRDYDGKDYKNFYGMLRLTKINNHWAAHVGKMNKQTGNQDVRLYRTFDDDQKQLVRKPAKIGVYIAQYGARDTALLAAHRVRVARLNRLTEKQIPYIVQPGDKIVFDHAKKKVMINGEPRVDLKAFGGDWWELKKGRNVLQVFPNIPFTCRFQERYL
ncbi:phage tail family protein [Priestia filamentosa]|uniref:distal tail protein Dit n=1 Tax=Priestia filamentosa TaxID=1402861 RepID=UPI0039828B84